MATMRATRLTMWVIALAASLAIPQTTCPADEQVIEMSVYEGPDVTDLTSYGNCQWLYPLDEPNEALVAEPSYGSDKRVYYAARYGDAKDNIFTFVIDESDGAGTGFDTLYADLNNDNRLDAKKERFDLELSGLTTREARNVRITLSVAIGKASVPYSFDFAAFRYKDSRHLIEKVHATCRNSSIVVGQATFGGVTRKIALADLDSNGLFNDYEMGLFQGDRFFVDFDGDGAFRGRKEKAESFPYAQFAEIGGSWYTIEAAPDGQTVRIREAQPSFGSVTAPKHIKGVGLSSPRQFQSLDLRGGPVKALTGTYRVNGVSLEIVDEKGRTWSTGGRYRSAGPPVTIEPDGQARLPDVLPLTISTNVLATLKGDTVELEVQIADAHGGQFGTLRMDNQRHQPPASLEIRDAQGKEVEVATLEYG